jgi:hypothetical protein
MLPCARDYMMEHGMAAEKYHVVPNGVDVAEWQGADTPLPAEHLAALAKLYGKPDEYFLAMVGFRSGLDMVKKLPPPGALVITTPRPGLAEFLQYVEQLSTADFAELINTAEFMLAQYPESE